MAALNRPTNATYTIHESVTVDTTGELFVLGMFCSARHQSIILLHLVQHSTVECNVAKSFSPGLTQQM